MSSLKSFYDRLPSWIQWALWCGVVLGFDWLLRHLLGFYSLSPFILVGLGTAIFLFIEKPLVALGIPEAFETGATTILALLFLLHLGWTYLEPKIAKEELYSQACNPASPEMRCYLFSRDNCLMVWNQYYQDCQIEVKKNQDPARKTSLLGPTIRLCTYKKFDKSFQSTRRMDAPEDCKPHFAKMDAFSL